jgi:hypothetical protein
MIRLALAVLLAAFAMCAPRAAGDNAVAPPTSEVSAR